MSQSSDLGALGISSSGFMPSYPVGIVTSITVRISRITKKAETG
jgi:hypothetical protein